MNENKSENKRGNKNELQIRRTKIFEHEKSTDSC